jgi:hypothetical protein
MNVLSVTNHKAIKPHLCNYCCGKINIGDVYHKSAIVNDGVFYTFKNHTDCQKIAEKLKMFDENEHEGLTGEMFAEYIIDEYYSITEGKTIASVDFAQKLEFVIKHHF